MTYQQQGFDLVYLKEVNQRENLINKFTYKNNLSKKNQY